MFSILKISLSPYTISEDIVELDVLDFDNEKKPVVAKRSYRLRILFRFVQDPDI